MLELKDIVKNYESGDSVVKALDGVSLCFRENEFVSILGASGCGKTTMLNIIGGLDRYTSGDLIIKGKSTKLFRAPYGDYDTQLVKIARREGFQVVQWDVDSLDWKDIPSDEIISRVTQKVKNGSVILFHNGAKNTPEALRKLIPLLKEKGYTFVTVGDLIYKDKYSISSEGEQIKY